MSVYRRRYNRDKINKVKFDSVERERENSLYAAIKFDAIKLSLIKYCIDDHTDYVILSAINFWKNGVITQHELDKTIDIIEGYYFAFEEGLITALQLYQKLNDQIMIEQFHQVDFDYVGIYEGRCKIDFD